MLKDLYNTVQVRRQSSLSTKDERAKLNARRRAVAQAALEEYQDEWLLKHEEECFDTLGILPVNNGIEKARFAHFLRCMPEHMGVAGVIKHAVPYTPDTRVEVLNDMITLAQQETVVYHRPNEVPEDGRCPVTKCSNVLSR